MTEIFMDLLYFELLNLAVLSKMKALQDVQFKRTHGSLSEACTDCTFDTHDHVLAESRNCEGTTVSAQLTILTLS